MALRLFVSSSLTKSLGVVDLGAAVTVFPDARATVVDASPNHIN